MEASVDVDDLAGGRQAEVGAQPQGADRLFQLAEGGCAELFAMQRTALGR